MVQARRGPARRRHRARRERHRPPRSSSSSTGWRAATPEQRRQVPGLNPERADIILAGLAVTAELLRLAARALDHRERVRAPRGAAARDGRGQEPSAAAIRSGSSASSPSAASATGGTWSRCATWRSSSSTSSAPALGCEPEERLLLEAAGLLHDVGQLVSYRKHHKHSYPAHHPRRAAGPAAARAGAGGAHQPLSPADRPAEEAPRVRRAPAARSGGRAPAERRSCASPTGSTGATPPPSRRWPRAHARGC